MVITCGDNLYGLVVRLRIMLGARGLDQGEQHNVRLGRLNAFDIKVARVIQQLPKSNAAESCAAGFV